MKYFWVFAGQGAQSPGMGRDLYESSAAAKACFEEADAVLGRSLTDLIFNGTAEDLTRTANCQCAIYTVSCAALAAFREKFPDAAPVGCAGLSLGEYAALFAAGAFSFADGLKLLQERSRLMDEACLLRPGTMASALGGEAEKVREVCASTGCYVANYNCPGQIVISGEAEPVGQAVELLRQAGCRKVVPLNVAGGFHSPLMASAGEGLAAFLEKMPLSMPQIPVWHNLTAKPAADVTELKANLAGQVAGSVRWEESVRAMAAAGGEAMIEFGPGSVLTGLMKRTIPELPRFNVNSVETLNALTL